MKTVPKAFAYITQGCRETTRLLVFRHADFPEAGVQVPAGTIAAGETAAIAALREAREETGLTNLGAPRFLGMQVFDARPLGKPEIHERHFFHLEAKTPVPEAWRHHEQDSSDTPGAIAFDLYWVTLEQAEQELVANHGQLLSLLRERP